MNMGGTALQSIQENKVKVGAMVQNVKRENGVDKVWIIAHSKGGLDSR